jgi:hypothetical protein
MRAITPSPQAVQSLWWLRTLCSDLGAVLCARCFCRCAKVTVGRSTVHLRIGATDVLDIRAIDPLTAVEEITAAPLRIS